MLFLDGVWQLEYFFIVELRRTFMLAEKYYPGFKNLKIEVDGGGS